MGLKERRQGERGERWLRDCLRARGYQQAVRSRQRSGSPDSPDVLEHDTPIHWEMKWGYEGGVSIKAILAKALEESPEGGYPVGVWKPKRQRAMAFLYLDDLLDLVRKVYEPSDV